MKEELASIALSILGSMLLGTVLLNLFGIFRPMLWLEYLMKSLVGAFLSR